MVAVAKFLFLVIVVSSWIGCSNKPTISGIIQFSEGEDFQKKVYLIQPQNLNDIAASFFGKVIDSAIIESNGTFQFNNLPAVSEPTLFELAVQQKGSDSNQLQNDDPSTDNYIPFVLQENESIKITAHGESFQQNFSIKNPSEVNKELLALRDIKLQSFLKNIKNKQWDVHEGSQLLEKEEALLNYQKALIGFAENANALLPALVALRWVSPQNDYERTPEFLFQQCEQWKENKHPWARQLCEKANKEYLPVLEGDTFPDAKLPLSSGETTNLYANLGSKLTIIDLWASWCVPCRKENRDFLVPLWDAYYEKGFQIIAYGLETNNEAWKSAIEKDGAYRWLHASDLQGDEAAFMKTLRIQTIPANFILDTEGKVIAKNLHGEKLQQFVSSFFEGK
ncbi:MAG: TlpA disulfide reductase family protein [Flavobacteriaceae bacterium]